MPLIDFLLTQEAVVTPFLREAGGEDIYGDPETRKCRLQLGPDLEHTYKNPDGTFDQVLARGKMYCTGEPIPARSKVMADGEEYIVLTCYRARGFKASHLEVVLE